MNPGDELAAAIEREIPASTIVAREVRLLEALDRYREATAGKADEFAEWLEHYRETTGRKSVRGSTPARKAFRARRQEGRTLDELKAATVGCHGDDFCRSKGYDVPETILRASKVERYIALGSQPVTRTAREERRAHWEREGARLRARLVAKQEAKRQAEREQAKLQTEEQR